MAISSFERCALASKLVSQEDLDLAKAALRWSEEDEPDAHAPVSDTELPDKLVEMGRLNAWQAAQLREGRSKFNLGEYWIIDSIGQGGMGQVFKAEHGLMGRVVAVKVLPRSRCTPEAVASFTREVRALAKLDHPNLVRALDAGQDGNVYYLVTEYVPGADLRRFVRNEGPLSMPFAASVIAQVSEGLQHAHDCGLIHRDIKPGNILVTPEGKAKLSDLGLAGPLDGDAVNDPRYGKIVGTADYLSPDHIKTPWDPQPAWDIYSLGCTLYYAVTGKVPFPGGGTKDKARAHCELRPLDPRRLNRDLTAEFVDVIADMMAKDPNDRVPSAADVVHRLAPWLEGTPSETAARRIRASAGAPTRQPPAEGADAGLEDTQSSFPEMPEPSSGSRGSHSEVSQSTSPVGSASEDTREPAIRTDEPAEEIAILRPLLILVGLPIVLVSTVLLISWLVSLFS